MTEESREKSGVQNLGPTSSVDVSISQVVPATPPTLAAPVGSTAPALRARGSKPAELLPRLQNAFSRWVPRVQYQLTRLGPAGTAGIGASAAAAVIGVVALVSLRTANESLNAQILRARHRPEVTVTPEQGLIRAMAQLPTRAQLPAVLGQVLAQANAAGVQLEKGRYTYVASSASGFGRYVLDFPLAAPYPGVRDFINRTLTHVPAAGLDKLSIQRKVVGDTQVNAEVRFVIFTRDR